MYENRLTRWKGLRKTIWWKSIWSDSTIPDEKGPAYNFCSRSRSHFELATVQTLMEKNESTVRQCPPFFNQALTRIHCGNLICWRAIWLTGVAELVVQGGIRIRYRPRFFVQVGHQTKYASIGNRHFFTISCNRQTYQNYEQPPQSLQNLYFFSFFGI